MHLEFIMFSIKQTKARKKEKWQEKMFTSGMKPHIVIFGVDQTLYPRSLPLNCWYSFYFILLTKVRSLAKAMVTCWNCSRPGGRAALSTGHPIRLDWCHDVARKLLRIRTSYIYIYVSGGSTWFRLLVVGEAVMRGVRPTCSAWKSLHSP